MGKFSVYNIVLKNLGIGKHDFTYTLRDTFFSLINDEESDVKRGEIDVDLQLLHNSASLFELNFTLKGNVIVPCDRCLDDVVMPVDTTAKLYVKFGQEYSEESDEIVVIPESEGEINIAWFLYEFIILALPIKHVHPFGQCNREVMSKLKKHRAVLKNDDDVDFDDDMVDDDIVIDDFSDSSTSDPRWDGLKDINN